MTSQRWGWQIRRVRLVPRAFLRGLALVIAAGMSAALPPGAAQAALVDWLVLLIDASESIDSHEYRLQHQAYVNVLHNPDIGLLLEGSMIAIVEFATAPRVVVAWTDAPRQAARAYAGRSRSVRGPGSASLTGIARALALALDILEDKAGRTVIDISGDGPTTSTGSRVSGRSAGGRSSWGSRSMAWRFPRPRSRRSTSTTPRTWSRDFLRSRASTSTSSARC